MTKLLPEGNQVVPLEDQSNGEHDFDVLDGNDQKIGAVEVTAAIHEDSMRSIHRERNREPIHCPSLRKGWLLMAHNPDPRWIEEEGVKHIAVLEKHGLTEFGYNAQFAKEAEVAVAIRELFRNGIENGGEAGSPGSITFLSSRGETSEDYVVSSEQVTDVLFEALARPDNKAKLSTERHGTAVDRHFFVEIDRATNPAAGCSMAEVEPPPDPPNLMNRATHVWAAMRLDGVIIVWRGTQAGWKRCELAIDESLCAD